MGICRNEGCLQGLLREGIPFFRGTSGTPVLRNAGLEFQVSRVHNGIKKIQDVARKSLKDPISGHQIFAVGPESMEALVAAHMRIQSTGA